MRRQELGLAGWESRSVWGRDERNLCYFAHLWDNGLPADPVTGAPHAFIEADSATSLAERIAETTGRSPEDVRQAMRRD